MAYAAYEFSRIFFYLYYYSLYQSLRSVSTRVIKELSERWLQRYSLPFRFGLMIPLKVLFDAKTHTTQM